MVLPFHSPHPKRPSRWKDAAGVTLVALALFFAGPLQACSPWQPMTYTWQVVGNTLEINLNTHTGWQCCYIGRIELRCSSQSFTGTATHSTNQVCKGNGGGNFSTWTTNPIPFQTVLIDLSAYCPGEELKWRARESGPDGFGPYTATVTFTVPGVNAEPLALNVTGDPLNVCPGDCASLTASAAGGCGTISYSWSQGGTGTTATVCPTQTTTYSVTATATSQCGAFESVTSSITVNVDLAPNAGVASLSPPQVCLGESTTLSLTGMDGSIQWQSANAAAGPWTDIPGATDDLHVFGSVTGITFFRAVVSNTFCPPSISNVISVNIEPVPPVDFLAPNTCANAPVAFADQSGTTPAPEAWDWDFGDGGTSTLQSPVHTYTAPGTYAATLTVTFENGCVGSVTEDVTILPVPEPDFTATLACANVATEFTDLSTVEAPANVVGWGWDLNGDGVPDLTTQNGSNVFGTGGTYPVTLTVVSDQGCSASITQQVPVTIAPTASFFSTTVCNGFNTAFTDQSLGNPVLWDWDLADGNSANAAQFAHLYASAGVYNVSLTVTNAQGCPDKVTQEVVVWPTPIATFTSNDPTGCSPVCIDFNSTSSAPGSTIAQTFWNFGNGTSSTETTFQRCFFNDHPTDDFAYDVRLVVVNDLGCRDTLTLANYIEVYHNPQAFFSVTPTVTNMYYPNFVMLNQSVGASEYLWDLADGSTSTEVNLLHTYADTGTYAISLTAITTMGCTDTYTIPVVVKPIVNLYVPNAFTPDGDGLNDQFFFTGFGILEKDLEFFIHDRWGQVVFETNQFKAWDGTSNGKQCPVGVYAYSIRYKDSAGGSHFKQGHVTLVR